MSNTVRTNPEDKPTSEEWHDRVCQFLGVPQHLWQTMEFSSDFDPWKDWGVPYSVKQLRIHIQ